jgi:exodeoxyribonuclease VII small subunit
MAKVISFEKSILDLEAVVLQLEKGDLSLEDALKQYEQGIKLARTCQTTLSEAEKKIERLNTQSSMKGPSDHE